jgi:hypothetical protein
MSPKLRFGLAIGLVCVGVMGLAVGVLYWSSQYVPPFYTSAVALDAEVAQRSSDAMLRQTTALVSDIRRGRPWQMLFTAEQINGWLAYDVPRNHPDLFPPEVHDPRVQIEDDLLKIAFRWTGASWSAIVSCQVEVYLHETNVIAVRIHQVRAGKLPLPLGGLVESFVAAGREAGLLIDQRQVDNDPLLLVTLPAADSDKDQLLLESFELRDGKVFLAGRPQADAEEAATVAVRPKRTEPIETQDDAEKTNVQR